MARTEKEKKQLHGACAKALMGEYGVPKELFTQVVDEIDKIYHYMTMAHGIITLSIRGFDPRPQTRTLEDLLVRNKTHEPKHHKGQMERRPELRGRYEETSCE